jgi:glutathione synthase/RimK-type ligase-like ATP-grasp enzyme
MRIASRQYSDESQLAELESRLAASPGAVEDVFERACAFEDLGRASASQAYLDVLARDPHHLGALTNLGLMVRETGDTANARAFFTAAVTHHPLAPIAYVNLAQTLFEQGEVDSAVAQFHAALHLDPGFFAAHHGLGLLYEAIGDDEAARRHLTRAFADRAAWTLPYRGTGRPLRVLLLVSARGGDIVMHPFLDDRIVETTMFVPEGFKPDVPLPQHDVVFNGIGDADRCGKALAAIRAVIDASPRPVINAPERVLASGRASTAQRLAGVPDVVAPRTELRAREALTAPALLADGWTFPLILRTPGFQAGRHTTLVTEPDELEAAVASLPGNALFAIAFVDTRGADEFFRKYRVLFVDGRLHPVHLAIASGWKVHYFSSDMAERADHRAEERLFLNDMAAALGPRVCSALHAIAARLGLDYGGVDFGLDAAGNVVVFEANATMAVYRPEAEERWSYRHPAYDAVVAAVHALIRSRAAA